VEGEAGMEDEEEETRMDERASGDNTGVVCRWHRVNRRTRLSTDDKPENPALLFPSLLPFPSLPFPPVSRRQEIGRCNVCQTLAATSDTQIITTHAAAAAG